jgi:hypothetical protein
VSGTRKFYAEGRDAFRSSVPYLRHDSVDAPSLWEMDEVEQRERLDRVGAEYSGASDFDGGNGGLTVPASSTVKRRQRSLSWRSRT